MALRLLIAFFLLAVPLELPGCGPFIPEALYTLKLQPERAETQFARGELGVVAPTYKRFYLVIAYRYLTGVGLSDAERSALFPSRQAPTDEAYYAAREWLKARSAVPGAKPIQFVNADHPSTQAGTYFFFENCHPDAFRTAIATLQERIRQYGASSPLVADWLAAQDIVFHNCSGNPEIPQPASDPRLRADRAYQIAAANFYAGRYDDAQADFAQIAADQQSPWHSIAPYLEARCSIRKGDFAEAAEQLRAIGSAPALRLLQYMKTQSDPAARIRELAQTLVKPALGPAIAQDLDDYRLLLDKVDKPPREDDLTDWIKSYQNGERDHIFDMWRQKQSLPWLVAAMEQTRPADTAAPELLAAAAKIKSDSPGYITIAWHTVRLLPDDEARAKTDEVLKLDMPAGARNLFRGRRMELARGFEEFLEFAPRTVAGQETDVEDADPKDEQLLGEDSQKVLNRLPLTMLKQASESTLLPAKVRQQLANVVWTRSVLLQPSPSFDDVYKLLKTPGLHFEVDKGFGRYTEDPAAIDPFRDNWWCSQKEAKPETAAAMPAFLTAAQIADGRREWARLAALDTGPDWLTAQALQFARKIPNDPRIPEALHLAVRSTRYGCTDKDTGDFSKRAFDLLHQKYPNSPWTAQTKYWFK
jgi:tetratricopeptide (TPR) repeat protein